MQETLAYGSYGDTLIDGTSSASLSETSQALMDDDISDTMCYE